MVPVSSNGPGLIFSPAKINLGLEIFHRSSSGKHYLASIFLPVSFGDTIEITLAEQDYFSSTNYLEGSAHAAFEAVSERSNFESNLLWKALKSTQELRQERYHVHLAKRVPAGAGLGGGSSNAGSLLRHIYLKARANGLPINPQSEIDLALALLAEHDPLACKLREIASWLGSDVSFFLINQPAVVHGLGEKIKPVAVGQGQGILALPPIFCDTAQAFSLLKRPLQPDPPPESLFSLTDSVQLALRNSDWAGARSLKNDFEEVIFKSHPALAAIKAGLLQEGALFASLSGSGSALFGLFPLEFEIGKACSRLSGIFSDVKFIAFSF